MKGCYNRVLMVDASRQSSRAVPLPDELLRRTLGGKGLATHLLLKHNPPGVDPLP